jgi:hypothetical protein
MSSAENAPRECPSAPMLGAARRYRPRYARSYRVRALEGSSAQGESMKNSFVFIFRQGARRLSEEEQKSRTAEVRSWALQQIENGRDLDPRILNDESYRLGEGTPNGDLAGRVIALNFIDLNDFNEAVQIAKSHPGLRYGVNIEVRPWKDPRSSQRA